MTEKRHSAAGIPTGVPKVKKSRRQWRRLVLLLLAVAIGAYFLIPAVNSRINGVVFLFSTMSVETIIGYIRGFGPWAAAVSFLLMMFQSMIAPLPAFLITFANAAVFGWQQGAILSWSSAMAGAALCFFLARVLGRDAVERFTGQGMLAAVDQFFVRYGKNTILVCRLLPFVSFDYVSYAAGLTPMGFWGFFIATGIGQLPATIVYSYVGGMLTGGAKYVMLAILITSALAVLVWMAKKIYNEKHQVIPNQAATPALAEAGPAAGADQA